MPVITRYPAPWQPPSYRPSTSRGPVPRGSGIEEGGPPDKIGRVIVMVSPPGAIAVGQQVRLTAVRTGGSAPLTYAWEGPTGPISGATGSTYTFTPGATTDSGTYTVTVTSPDATDGPVSAGVAVTVVPPPPVIGRFQMEDSGFILAEAGGFILEEG